MLTHVQSAVGDGGLEERRSVNDRRPRQTLATPPLPLAPSPPLQHTPDEDPEYLTRHLLTYLGNKRALLDVISAAVLRVRERLGGRRLSGFDAFAGSGVVSRLLKAHCSTLVSNDFEEYATVVGRCFLTNRGSVDKVALADAVRSLNERVVDADLPSGFIEELYAPRDDERIDAGERVFYTTVNARRLDNYRRLIEREPTELHDLLLGPLLSEASIRANTAGVFKGFYKDRKTGRGRFGGSGSDALARITGTIVCDVPVLSRFDSDVTVTQADALDAARALPTCGPAEFDLAYFDPPYNQHPYGSNYFMLNLLARYERPEQVSEVSGIPPDWQRSRFNVRSQSAAALEEVLSATPAKFLLVSYNNEGFVTPEEMTAMLERLGHVERVDVEHPAFRGSRSFANRALYTTESLFLVER